MVIKLTIYCYGKLIKQLRGDHGENSGESET